MFSGPVTSLTARRVRYGVGPDLICQPKSSASYTERDLNLNLAIPHMLANRNSNAAIRPLPKGDAFFGRGLRIPHIPLAQSSHSSKFLPVAVHCRYVMEGSCSNDCTQ